MAEHITRIRTESGDKQIDYNALANLPTTDKTLSVEDQAADGKSTGNAINNLNNNLNNLNSGLNNLKIEIQEQINELATSTSLKLAQKAETATYTSVFAFENWIGDYAPYTQTVTIPGLRGTDNPFVDVDMSNVTAYIDVMQSWSCVGRVTVTNDETVVAYCYEEKPEVDLPIIMKVVR